MNNSTALNIFCDLREIFETKCGGDLNKFKDFLLKNYDINKTDIIKKQKFNTIQKHILSADWCPNKSAYIEGNYRFSLERSWDPLLPSILYIGKNPSTADAEFNDPTIRILIGITKRLGYGGFCIYNLNPYRSEHTDVAIENCSEENKIKNRKFIEDNLHKHNMVVYMYGDFAKQLEPEWLKNMIEEPYCFEHTNDNYPRHPQMWKQTNKSKSELITKFRK